ncbi:thioredoxin 1 [Nonlabens sp. Hel1_33_55]|uniref:thioredoxin family protein n=1 Tax=Nonlabens sp. Hel1_33_55 TaxID=1336802 RepID=UPI000875B65D|nr:thioredoxin family protein [Nonlabens sp. Hel1_33_55]SCY13013.1 thioredoxin 1 [Nonlabens sp. Hel1_33_55]
MKYILITFCSLFMMIAANAQDFIKDDEMANTVIKADDEMKVLYFTASWCGPCKMMKPGIAKMASDPDAVGTIYKMDIDQNITDDIIGISGVPTFMFIKNGTILGQHTGAMGDSGLKTMFAKHAKMKPTGNALTYKPVPSKYDLVAGAHPKLTKKNLETVWHNEANLNKLAWSIYNNLEDTKDLQAGLNLVNRSFELKKNSGTLFLKTSYLNKLGATKDALSTGRKAREMMVANGEHTGTIDKLLTEIKG